MQDGIHAMLPRDLMSPSVRKYWDFVNLKPDAPVYQTEFGYYSIEKWMREEGLKDEKELHDLCSFDAPGACTLGGLGSCEAEFFPRFEEKVLKDMGDYELVQDHAGRHVKFFKGRRNGFMPEYVDHPVKDWKTWEEHCKWRMDPTSPDRLSTLNHYLPGHVACARQGMVMQQYTVGGYMYLRSLMGPEGLLYMFYDDPDLIHDCMQSWFRLADSVLAFHQQHVSLDFLLIDEDICYKGGSLISPDMIREFLMPYYQQLIHNCRRRQLDQSRRVSFYVGSDGFFDPIIPLYREMGMDMLGPFEVAAGSDVVRTGKEYPDLLITGGLDKREMAKGKDAIDRMVDAILPVMKKRGGYMPTCDHGVPEEVKLSDYLYLRKRLHEFG